MRITSLFVIEIGSTRMLCNNKDRALGLTQFVNHETAQKHTCNCK